MTTTSDINTNPLTVEGIPDTADPTSIALCRSRLISAVKNFMADTGDETIDIRVTTSSTTAKADSTVPPVSTETQQSQNDEFSLEKRAMRYAASEPLWGMEYLIVPQSLKDELLLAIETITLEPLVFDTWGLRAIEPFPRSALNFHGAPGTGKTLAAHGVAAALGTQILVVSYAQIESMYHGEGPKNVEALFHAAERDEAVLFIDEADSLLSRRLTNVTQGSEQAINSMRSQLLICLERFHGVVIFATNLVSNYDSAFETRVRHIKFPMPDIDARTAIWRKHIPDLLPLSDDVDILDLAQYEENFCGRDIKNAVVNAALQTARIGANSISHQEFIDAIDRIVDARNALKEKENSFKPNNEMEEKIRRSIKSSETINNVSSEIIPDMDGLN
jgi:hypothetical protein